MTGPGSHTTRQRNLGRRLPSTRHHPLLSNRQLIFAELAAGVDEVLAVDATSARAQNEGWALVAQLMIGRSLVDDVSAADPGADGPDGETLGAGIDRLLVRHDVAGVMKEYG